MMIEPGHPFQGRQLDALARLPGSAAMYQLCLVQAVDGLGQRIVIAVALTTHRGLNACFSKTLAVADGNILRAYVAMVNKASLRSG